MSECVYLFGVFMIIVLFMLLSSKESFYDFQGGAWHDTNEPTPIIGSGTGPNWNPYTTTYMNNYSTQGGSVPGGLVQTPMGMVPYNIAFPYAQYVKRSGFCDNPENPDCPNFARKLKQSTFTVDRDAEYEL